MCILSSLLTRNYLQVFDLITLVTSKLDNATVIVTPQPLQGIPHLDATWGKLQSCSERV